MIMEALKLAGWIVVFVVAAIAFAYTIEAIAAWLARMGK